MTTKLTKEELRLFRMENNAFFKEYGLEYKIPLARRIAKSLQSYAVAYLIGCGYMGVRKSNKQKAIKLYLKASKFDPQIIEDYTEFRKELNKNFI